VASACVFCISIFVPMVSVFSSDDNEGGASNDDVKDDDGGHQERASEDGT